MDKILIEGLTVNALIGVYDWERLQKQRLVLDLELYTDLQQAADSDNVADTIDYAKVAELLIQVADNSDYQLLEALAGDMVQQLFNHFPAQKLRLKVSKPDIVKEARNVAIEMVRER